LDSKPAPTVAALAAKLVLMKERRSACLRISVSDWFIVDFLLCIHDFDFDPSHTPSGGGLAREINAGIKHRRIESAPVKMFPAIDLSRPDKVAGMSRSGVTAPSNRSQGIRVED
jgi:hypothetical protein